MLKAIGHNPEGEPTIFLGLSGENVTRLVANEPILVDVAGVSIALFYSKKEEDLQATLMKAVNSTNEKLKNGTLPT